MTKNEYIASLLLEAADLLKEDNQQESLNEGIGLGILGTIVGAITIFGIYAKISSKIQENKLYKDKHSLYEYEKFKALSTLLPKIIDSVKYIKYKKSTKDILISNMEILRRTTSKLEKLDNELFSIKSADEYYKKKEKMEKEYNKLYKDMSKALEASAEKLKNEEDEYIENDFSILHIIMKYVDEKNHYYRNLDGDDYWESVNFLYDMYKKHEEGENVDKAFEDVYDTLNTFPEYSTYEMKGFLEPLKYITIQVIDKKK